MRNVFIFLLVWIGIVALGRARAPTPMVQKRDGTISMHDSILLQQHNQQNQNADNDSMRTCASPGGVWLPQQETCQCCPGYHGTGCAIKNQCERVTCLNGGSCDAKTGQCLCPKAFMGAHCEIPYCGEHGLYDPFAGECTCHRGWSGQWCDNCALPTRTGYKWTCVPGRTSDYILMQLSGDVANQVVQGHLNPLGQSYPGLFPRKKTTVIGKADRRGVKGHDGRYYDCACRPVDNVQTLRRRRHALIQQGNGHNDMGKRYSWSDLGAFDMVVTDCIADGNLTMQQMDDLNCLWDTCVRQSRHGRLNDTWYIVGIVFIVLFIVTLILMIVTCFLWSYQLDRIRQTGESPGEYSGTPENMRSRIGHHVSRNGRKSKNTQKRRR